MLPKDAKERKALPIFTGVLDYFPDALLEVARVSRLGNDQHNPGQPLHWAREKSTDQLDSSLRHQMDHRVNPIDTDGGYHLAKAIWRLCAELQLYLEKEKGKPTLFEAIQHGSEEHKAWLKEAIDNYNEGKPVPDVK